MKSTVETLAPTRVKLSVEVPYEELRPSIEAAYKTIGAQVQVPGFRRGKVPSRIIDQRVGRGAVLQEAINEALPTFYQQAVTENSVRVLGRPEVDVSEVPDPTATDGELKFTAEVDVRPELSVPDLTTLSVTVDDLEVGDADVDERLDALRTRFGTLETVDRPAQTGDFLQLDLVARVEGEEVDSATGISYEIGSGTMLEGTDEAVVGLSADEEAIFTSPLRGGEHAGADAEITVVVKAVKERALPAADDDFAQLASEFDTVEELRADLRAQVESTKRVDQGVQAREKVIEALLEAVEVPVPASLVDDEVARHLEGEGKELDDPHGEEIRPDAEKALKGQLLLDAIAEQEKVQVSRDELIQFLVSSSRQYGMEPNEFAKAVDEAGQVPAMVQEVGRRKALAIAMERATVTDASGATVDLEASLSRQAAGVPDVPQTLSADGVADELSEGAAAEAAEGADVTDETPEVSTDEASDQASDGAQKA
ncbi:trigger factor [Aquipuribacter hungaricus]|uniref:Trigger factor n=1 Tax=Aquipuribacter hungaricus TaxID=545624 RepID=A0ABV7WED7_9MICO